MTNLRKGLRKTVGGDMTRILLSSLGSECSMEWVGVGKLGCQDQQRASAAPVSMQLGGVRNMCVYDFIKATRL